MNLRPLNWRARQTHRPKAPMLPNRRHRSPPRACGEVTQVRLRTCRALDSGPGRHEVPGQAEGDAHLPLREPTCRRRREGAHDEYNVIQHLCGPLDPHHRRGRCVFGDPEGDAPHLAHPPPGASARGRSSSAAECDIDAPIWTHGLPTIWSASTTPHGARCLAPRRRATVSTRRSVRAT